MSGDMFDRQRAVPGWDHSVIEKQVAFVLGTGGIGSTVASCLARLGIKKIILLDFDCVEESNLNRQQLFCKLDVGRRKVDAAKDSLARLHNLQSEIVALHLDAVKEWGQVVAHAKECTVIFNCIDYGKFFDYAVSSLCKKLEVPYVAGASYGHTANSEYFNGTKEGPCWGCNNIGVEEPILNQLLPTLIDTYPNIEFIPKDPQVIGARTYGSSILPCSMASEMMVTNWLNDVFHVFDITPNWSMFNLADFSCVTFPVEKSKECKICSAL